MTSVRFGIDRLIADPALRQPLVGRRVALVAHPASLTQGLVHSLDAPMPGDEDESGLGATRDVPDWSLEPESLLARKELGAHIQAALEKLPPKLRAAVVLHDVEGLAYEEIALAEQIPLGTVKSRIFNARVALRDHLRPYLEA